MSDIVKWHYAENMVTMICACVSAYFISPWCFLLLLNISYVKRKEINHDRP
jgi:hypothetical protein